jgi:UDP-3-O-[3-hydroxymyristoyl] glucosamine N-acyltransferase
MATLQQLAELLQADLSGDPALEICGVASASTATPTSLVFAENEAALVLALGSKAGAVLTRESPVAKGNRKPTLQVANPRLAFARAAKFLNTNTAPAQAENQVHPTAVLGRSVTLGEGVRIDAGCVVGDGVVIGDGCPGTVLGACVIVHAGAVLGSDGFGYVRDPASGEYIQFPQQGTLVVEDDVEIGANTTIDRGALDETRIGSGTKIDNLVHIGHNVLIGRNVVIAAQTGISGSSTVGGGAVIAGQVGIADHVTIGPGVILGAQCGVPSNKKISGPGQLFWGTPARPIQQYLRELATMSRSARSKAKPERP